MTLGIQWSWKPDDKIKSVREVVDILAHTVGGDGNLLLNVGPMPDGRIEPRQAAVLKAVGAWLQRNGESIYGTRGGPWKPAAHVVSTRKGQVVYLHLLPGANGQASLPALPVRVQSATLMNGTKVDFHETDNVLTVTVAQAGLLDPDDTVVRLQLAGSALDLPAQEPLTTGAAPPAK